VFAADNLFVPRLKNYSNGKIQLDEKIPVKLLLGTLHLRIMPRIFRRLSVDGEELPPRQLTPFR